jgi:hypothetical protein
MFKFKDVNGDDEIAPTEDFAMIGDPFPDFTGGLSSSISYKNFDFHVTTSFSYGAQKIQRGFEDYGNLSGLFNVAKVVKHRWKSVEDPGDGLFPRAIATPIHRYLKSTWVLDASDFWIRDITLGYTFSTSQFRFLNSLNANKLRIYFNIQNAFLSNTNFQNPEASNHANNPLQAGEVRSTNYPLAKTFTFGINLNF